METSKADPLSTDLMLGPKIEGLTFKKEVKKLKVKLEDEAYEVMNSSKE